MLTQLSHLKKVPTRCSWTSSPWTEVRDRMENRTATVIVASAGTEQNGPHMVLGKHKFIIRQVAGRPGVIDEGRSRTRVGHPLPAPT